MILPSTLSQPIDVARTSIRQVNPLVDSRNHLTTAESFIVGIRQWVQMTPAIEEAIDSALQAITPLRMQHNSVVLDPARLDGPKAEFDERLDALAAALETAKPSDEANALGLGW